MTCRSAWRRGASHSAAKALSPHPDDRRRLASVLHHRRSPDQIRDAARLEDRPRFAGKPSTGDLIVLDHAGNFLHLGLITNIHHDRLGVIEPGEKRERKGPNSSPRRARRACA